MAQGLLPLVLIFIGGTVLIAFWRVVLAIIVASLFAVFALGLIQVVTLLESVR